MKKNRLVLFIIFAIIFMSVDLQAYDFTVSGLGRVRYESLSNSDYDSSLSDYKSFTGSRFILTSELTSEQYKIFFQPQFSKIWGLNESGAITSGATNDTALNVHQSIIQFPIGNIQNLKFKLGRQELSYGDELVLGSVIWSNVGRSFDALKLEWEIGSSRLDLFSSKLVDLNSTTPGIGDKDLSGIYFVGRNDIELLKETEIYIFNLNDSTVTAKSDLFAYGLRLKGSQSHFDYRFEATFEDIDSTKEYQGDTEVGLSFANWGRLGLNYFLASDSYNQLFPTAHKWLGIGDSISRKNIEGYQIKHNIMWSDVFNSELAYFKFSRRNDQVAGFNFSGSPLGTASLSSKDIGSEFDLVLNYIQSPQLSYQLGNALFVPGTYYKQSGMMDNYLFSYFQVTLKL